MKQIIVSILIVLIFTAGRRSIERQMGAINGKVPGVCITWNDGSVKDWTGNMTPANSNGASFVSASLAGGFDGVNDYVLIGKGFPVDATLNGSISYWLYPTSTITADAGFVFKAVSEGTEDWGMDWLAAWGDTRGIVGGTSITPDPDWTPPANTWSLVTMTWDGTSIRLWKNNAQHMRTVSQSGGATTTGLVRVGCPWPGSPARFFKGYMDTVRVWKTALSSNEITQIYNEERKYH